jgi:hypothetical protein
MSTTTASGRPGIASRTIVRALGFSTSFRGTGACFRSSLVLIVAAVFLLLPTANAAAGSLGVSLTGGGEGKVTSSAGSPPIDCSIAGGVTSGTCATTVADDFSGLPTTMTATAEAGSVFAGWTVGGGTCTGSATPCQLPLTTFFVNYSLTASFVPAPDAPVASSDGPSAVGDSSAVLHGRVNPNGSAVSGCRFEYGTTTDYGATAPCDQSPASLGSGTVDSPVTASIDALDPGVTYRYRLVASNIGGSSNGGDRSFATTGVSGCPNAGIRAAQGIAAILLPECMALELVSPPKKLNQRATWPHVSPDGRRVRFSSTAALADTPGQLQPTGDPYVATRDTAGWTTESTSPPAGVTEGQIPTSFTPDFSRWFLVNSATVNDGQLGVGRSYQGGLGGVFAPLSPVLAPLGDARPDSTDIVQRSELQAASADHSHLYFAPGRGGNGALGVDRTTAYLAGDPMPAGTGESSNVYVARLGSDGQPSLALLARDSDGKVWGGNCGARLGGIGPLVGLDLTAENGSRTQGALSADGARAYFSTRAAQPDGGSCADANKMRLLRRLETSSGPWISRLIKEPSGDCVRVAPVCSAVDGDDFYQGASVDGDRVYFTTNRQLADSDVDGSASSCSVTAAVAGCDLYLYDAARPVGQRLVQVSAGEVTAGHPAVGSGANVYNSIAAISGDGSRVYFVAQGALTDDANPAGDQAVAGQPNFYSWDVATQTTTFVGTLVAGDQLGLWGTGGGTFRNDAYPAPATASDSSGAEVGGDGHILLFRSKAALTDDDSDGAGRDVFRYDTETETLERITKASPGGADNGAFDVAGFDASLNQPPGTDFAEQGRWVSEDGQTVVFMTAEALVAGDLNGIQDAYLWRDGRLARLPGTANPDSTSTNDARWGAPVLSHDGSTVAFQSFSQLVAEDGDTISDIYVARVNGGFDFPRTGVPCNPLGDACQGAAAAPLPAYDRTAKAVPDTPASPPRGRIALRGLRASQRQALARGRRAKLAVTVNQAGRVSVRGLARVAGKRRRVISAARNARGATTVIVAVKLSRPARRQLARAGRLKLSLRVAFSKARTPLIRTVALTAPKANRRSTTKRSTGGRS